MEDGILTYKALIMPAFGHGAPVWHPIRSSLKHPVDAIQKVQNACLRAVTGCHSAASIQHLHDECRMLQVREHLDMQSSQFLLNTRQSTHASHDVTGQPPGPRPDRKPTLQHRYNRDIDQFTNNAVALGINYKRDVKSIHTNSVTAALAKREASYVLGFPTPEVHPSDATLPR
jgi:hypothetical protein